MKKIYYYRDMLERNLSKKELTELLEHNDQEVPSGVDKVMKSRKKTVIVNRYVHMCMWYYVRVVK